MSNEEDVEDVDSRKQTQRRYYKKNRGRCITNMKKWRANNSERLKIYAKKYYLENKNKKKEPKVNNFSITNLEKPITLTFD